MDLAVDEAILRLKAELLAADWRLNDRRAALLRQALTAVDNAAGHRRGLRAIVGMARAALDYQERRQWQAPPAVLDFLKQALARLVSLLEEEEEAAGEAEASARLHQRFLKLKSALAAGRGGMADG